MVSRVRIPLSLLHSKESERIPFVVVKGFCFPERMGELLLIKTHYDACKVLGIKNNEPFETVKSRYRKLIKLYHPDNYPGEEKKYERLCCLFSEAYSFIENEYKNGIAGSTYAPVNAPVNAKVVGTPVKKNAGAANIPKKKTKLEQMTIKKEQNEKNLRMLKEKAEEIQREENEKNKNNIKNQIRWLRVSQIVNDVLNNKY